MADNLEGLREHWVENAIANEFEGEPPSAAKHSDFARALDDLSRSAMAFARETNAPLAGEKGSFEYLFEQGYEIVQAIKYTVRRPEGTAEDQRKLKLWQHRYHPLDEIKRKVATPLQRQEVEELTGAYLNLPFRSQKMDRMLADMLVALELYAFGEHVYNQHYIPGVTSSNSPLAQKPILDYFVYRGISLAGLIVLWLILWGLWAIHIMPAIVGWWIGGIAFALAALDFAWVTLWLPVRVWQNQKQRRKTGELLVEMSTTYNELQSAGPISARHISERLSHGNNMGVVWPAPLQVLMDDILARGGRL